MGGAETIAIKGTWRRTAEQSCLRVRMSWDGRRLPLQNPNTRPGPRRGACKTLAQQRVPGCYANTLGAQTQLREPGTLRDLRSSCPQGAPPARSPGFTFRRAAWESAARRPLAVPSAPAAAAAAAAESRQREPGSLRPAPGRQAPPPGARPLPSTLAGYRADPPGLSGLRGSCSAPGRAATAAPRVDASRRPGCPKCQGYTPAANEMLGNDL